MELESKLNFTEICRCCKRTSNGMTSIFVGSVHPTYPPLQDMLRTIASLNIHENDGLPSLVCTSCIDNILDAYTFIIHLILVDEELWQIILARGKQTDTLSQDTYDLNQYTISTAPIKEENECEPVHDERVSDYVNDSLKVENLDEPMQNFYQDGSADNSYQNIIFAVKTEDVPVPENEEGNELLPQKERSKCVTSEQSFPEITTREELNHQEHYIESYEDIGESNSGQDLDAAETIDKPEEENKEISPKLRAKRRKITSNQDYELHDTPVEGKDSSPGLSLTLQEMRDPEKTKNQPIYAVNDDNLLKVKKIVDLEFEEELGADNEYQGDNEDGNCEDCPENELNPYYADEKCYVPEMKHEEISPKLRAQRRKRISNFVGVSMFKCKLCQFTNKRMPQLKLHLQSHFKDKPFACSKCNGTFTQKDSMLNHLQKCNGEIISLTLEDLKDPVKLKKYYTFTDIDGQNNDNDEDALRVFKCKLCKYSSMIMARIKQHLTSHTKYNFSCSKCMVTFRQEGNLKRHWIKCNGEISKNARKRSLTLQDLRDPLKLKEYYTVSERSDVQKYNCNLCAYTTWHKPNLARHYKTHTNETFACSKCNDTFSKRGFMERHWRNCKDELKKGNTSKQMTLLMLTSQNLENPGDIDATRRAEKSGVDLEDVDADVDNEDSNSADTVTDIDKQSKDNYDLGVRGVDRVNHVDMEEDLSKSQTEQRTTSQLTVFKCNLCVFTTVNKNYLKQHFVTHSKDRPFTCSKCNGTFARKHVMLKHWRICNGEIPRGGRFMMGDVSKQVIPLTQQELKDPLKRKKFYTVIHREIDMPNKDDDNLKVQSK